MLVRFLKDLVVFKDGINPTSYKKGEEADLPLDLANSLIKGGLAEEVKPVIEEKKSKKAESKEVKEEGTK